MTAAFAFSDVPAIGAVKVISSHGLRISDDTAVIGFDGIEMGEYYPAFP